MVQIGKAQKSISMENNSSDRIEITHLLEEFYFKGIYEGDVDRLRQIYHPNTLVLGDIKGVPYSKTLEQYLDGVKNRQTVKDSGLPFKGTIESIEIVNSIAIAKLNVKMYEFNYDEFLSFHKIEGKWIIVNKMLTHRIQ